MEKTERLVEEVEVAGRRNHEAVVVDPLGKLVLSEIESFEFGVNAFANSSSSR
jgi:hypothetical protein